MGTGWTIAVSYRQMGGNTEFVLKMPSRYTEITKIKNTSKTGGQSFSCTLRQAWKLIF